VATLGPVTDLADKLGQKFKELSAAKATGQPLPPAREVEPETPKDPTPPNAPPPLDGTTAEPVPAAAEPVAAAPPEHPAAPPAAAAPASEGSTPAVQPPPASDAVPTTSAVETLKKRGFNVEDPKLAEEYLRLETGFAEMKRKEKEQKAPAPPPSAPAEPEPAAAAPPTAPPAPATEPARAARAPQPPVETEPEHPAGPLELSEADQQEVQQLVRSDSTCRALAAQHKTVLETLPTLMQVDEDTGRVVGGRVFEIDSEIAELSRALKPPSKALKERGIEIVELSDYDKQAIQSDITKLKLERIEVVNKYQETLGRAERIVDRFTERQAQLRAPYEDRVQASRAEAEMDARVEASAQELQRAWTPAVDSALRANGVSERDAPGVKRLLQKAALAHVGYLPLEELPSFLERETKEAMQILGAHAENVTRSQVAQRDADIAALRPGAETTPAVAPSEPKKTTDLVEALRQKRLALLKTG
jgi:hypothetical protein